MIQHPFTHVGVVVPDLAEATRVMGAALGVEWCDVISWDLEVWTPTGIQAVTSTFTYSTGPGPRHELLQSVPGSLWEAGSSTAHHVGHWSSNLRADGAALEAEGYRLVGTLADDPGVPTGFAYFQHDAGGPLVELVDAALVPRFQRWWAGERF